MESPFIFPEGSQDLTLSLNSHEKTHGFVHPWWRDPRSELGEEHLPTHSQHDDHGQEELKPNLDSSRDPHSIEEGRTIILLFSVVFLILIIIILFIWVKRMKNAQVSNINYNDDLI